MNLEVEEVRQSAISVSSGTADSRLRSAEGGLDANHLNQKGIPTVTMGAGQHGPHTVDEYVDVREYLNGCRLALCVATV